jgi:ABC-type sugar transport system substrate-binding protein
MKKASLVVALLVMAVLIVSCKPAAATEAKKIVVGYSPHTFTATDFYKIGQTGLELKAEELGLNLEVVGKAPSTLSDAEGQLKIVEDFITSGVDYIWLVPVSVEAAPPMLEAAAEAGVPVFISHSLEPYPDPYEVFAYVGTDFMKTGTDVGNWVVEKYGCDIQFGIIRGAAGQYDTWRVESAVTAIQSECPNMTIYKSAYTDWATEKALTETATMLTAHPDVDLIYTPSSTMTLGAVEAIKEAGVGDTVKVLDYDLIPAVQQMCDETPQIVVGGLGMFPYKYGEVVAELIDKHEKGETTELANEVGGAIIECGRFAEFYPQWYLDLGK